MLPITPAQAAALSPNDLPNSPRVIFKLRAATPTRVDDGFSIGIKLGRMSSKLRAIAAPLFRAGQGNVVLKHQIGLNRIFVAQLSSDTTLATALATLAADPDIDYAEPDFVGYGAGFDYKGFDYKGFDYKDAPCILPLASCSLPLEKGGPILPNDRFLANQWGLNNIGQSGGKAGADIHALAAWDISTGISRTLIGMLDTGIDLAHPDLTKKIAGGYDFVNNDELPQDDNGHSTHTAGIAAAQSNNNLGVTGVCWECRMLAVKVLDDENRGYYSWWASGIEYAVDHGVHVINMSMGGNSFSLSLQDAVRYAYFANVPIIAAMMNEGSSTPNYPAAFRETIAVGMTNRNDIRDVRSSYGNHIHLVAPGTDIYSTMRGNTYAYLTGTSMATPHVTGVVGLLRNVSPNFTVEHIRRILQNGVDDFVGNKTEDAVGWDQYYGHGRLNALKAINYAQLSTLTGLSVSASDIVPAQTPQTLSASITPAAVFGAITYTWQATDLPSFIDRAESAASNVTMTWDMAGTKHITVTADNGFSVVTNTRTVEVFYSVQANFVTQPSPATGVAPFTVVFSNTSIGDGIRSMWAFGDGGSSADLHVTHTYTLPGTYSVDLTVANLNGLSATTQHPNAITVLAAPTSTANPTTTATPTVTASPQTLSGTAQLFFAVLLVNVIELAPPTLTPTLTLTVTTTPTPTPIPTKIKLTPGA